MQWQRTSCQQGGDVIPALSALTFWSLGLPLLVSQGEPSLPCWILIPGGLTAGQPSLGPLPQIENRRKLRVLISVETQVVYEEEQELRPCPWPLFLPGPSEICQLPLAQEACLASGLMLTSLLPLFPQILITGS